MKKEKDGASAVQNGANYDPLANAVARSATQLVELPGFGARRALAGVPEACVPAVPGPCGPHSERPDAGSDGAVPARHDLHRQPDQAAGGDVSGGG